MIHFTITKEAAAALRSKADPDKEWTETAVAIDADNVLVPFREVTIRLLAAIAFPGETISDTIMRLCSEGVRQ